MENKWKTIAIIFIVLCLFETSILVWAFLSGSKDIARENECSMNVCEEYNSYNYDSYNEVCYCFEDGEVAKQKYMK